MYVFNVFFFDFFYVFADLAFVVTALLFKQIQRMDFIINNLSFVYN